MRSTHVMEETDIGMLIYLISWGLGLLSNIKVIGLIENGSFVSGCHHLISYYLKLKEQLIAENPHWE